MNLNPRKLHDRESLAKLAGMMGLKKCAEIGVYAGSYSLVLCQNIPDITLLCVDTWKPSLNHVRQTNLTRAYRKAKRTLEPYRVVFMRMASLEAAKKVPEACLDFIYLDALHDEENVSADLNAWYPKLRAGGIMAGHDWNTMTVRKAVRKFVIVNNIEDLLATRGPEASGRRSWFWIK